MNFKAMQQSSLIYYHEKNLDADNNNKLYLVPVEAIVSTCIGVTDTSLGDDNKIFETTDWIFLKPRREWPDLLISIARDHMAKTRKRTLDVPR